MSNLSSFASFNYCRAFLAFFAIVCYSNSGKVLVSGGYPYSSDDLSVRQAQILDKLRGDMTLLMNEEIVPNELKEPSFGEMFLRNLEVNSRVRKHRSLIFYHAKRECCSVTSSRVSCSQPQCTRSPKHPPMWRENDPN
jgi:hypothetical protein